MGKFRPGYISGVYIVFVVGATVSAVAWFTICISMLGGLTLDLHDKSKEKLTLVVLVCASVIPVVLFACDTLYRSSALGLKRNLDYKEDLHRSECAHHDLVYTWSESAGTTRVGRTVVGKSRSRSRNYTCRFLADEKRMVQCTNPFVGQYCRPEGKDGFCDFHWLRYCKEKETWSAHLSGCMNRFLDRNVPELTLAHRCRLTPATLATLIDEPDAVVKQHVYS